jgi:hypothetical protein
LPSVRIWPALVFDTSTETGPGGIGDAVGIGEPVLVASDVVADDADADVELELLLHAAAVSAIDDTNATPIHAYLHTLPMQFHTSMCPRGIASPGEIPGGGLW